MEKPDSKSKKISTFWKWYTFPIQICLRFMKLHDHQWPWTLEPTSKLECCMSQHEKRPKRWNIILKNSCCGWTYSIDATCTDTRKSLQFKCIVAISQWTFCGFCDFFQYRWPVGDRFADILQWHAQKSFRLAFLCRKEQSRIIIDLVPNLLSLSPSRRGHQVICAFRFCMTGKIKLYTCLINQVSKTATKGSSWPT